MMNKYKSMLFLAAILLSGSVFCAEDEMQKLFESGRFKEAKELAQKLVAEGNTDGQLLFNGGLSAYMSKDYKVSIELWKKLKTKYPTDDAVRIKLTQSYEAIGDKTSRDSEIKDLYTLYNKDNSDFTRKDFFCRDQFDVAGKHIMVFEYFKLEGEMPKKWSFNILNPDGKLDYKISLGSYDVTNNYAMSKKPLPNGERYYHLDGYYDNGGHETFGFFEGMPKYDAIKANVSDIVSGKAEPTSGTNTN